LSSPASFSKQEIIGKKFNAPSFFLKKKKKSKLWISLSSPSSSDKQKSKLEKADKTLTSGLMSSDQLKDATEKKLPLEFEREERIRRNRREMGVGSPADKRGAEEGNEK
jgi:hypothetical protein